MAAPPPSYETHAELIERIIASTCRGHYLRPQDADDFTSWARERLLEGTALAKFQGRCHIRTFLVVVIRRLFLDYRNACWGKFRPSAEAKRLGAVAVLLERLTVRDGHSFDEASEIILTNSGVVTTREVLHQLAGKIPQRAPRRMVGDEALAEIAVESAETEAGALSHERRELRQRVTSAMRQAMERLESQDQIVLKMRFADGLPIATIARTLQADPKRMYRKVEQLLAALRTALIDQGVTREDAAELLDHLDLDKDEEVTA